MSFRGVKPSALSSPAANVMLVENQVGSAQFDQFGDAVAGGAQVFWEADGSALGSWRTGNALYTAIRRPPECLVDVYVVPSVADPSTGTIRQQALPSIYLFQIDTSKLRERNFHRLSLLSRTCSTGAAEILGTSGPAKIAKQIMQQTSMGPLLHGP
jgi:hypothetical protein